MLIINEVFTAHEISSIEDGDKLIKKYRKLLKTRKLLKDLKSFKSGYLKRKKLFKSWKSIKSGKKLSKNRNSSNLIL